MIWGTDKKQKKRNGCGLIILCLLAVWFFIPLRLSPRLDKSLV